MDKLTLTRQFEIQFGSLGVIEKEFWNVIISINTDIGPTLGPTSGDVEELGVGVGSKD